MSIDLIINALLTIAGFYLAYSYQRQIAIKVAERRLNAYAAMWSEMFVATPVRLAKWQPKPRPLTLEERQALFYAFTKWYYKNGNGMLLGGKTRELYLTAKDNLICPIECFEPRLVGSVANNGLKKVVCKENPSCGLGLGSEAKDIGDELILCLNVVLFGSRNLSFANHVYCFIAL